MCGRYASTRARQELIEQFQVQLDAAEGALGPDYNIAPTKMVPAVLTHPVEESAEKAVRQLRALRWGLVPSWAKDIKIGNRLINARAETVHQKPSFRRAFARRRCLLPADGFFEWYTPQGTEGRRPVKQPFFIRPRDGSVMAMAGLYELWRSPEDEWLWTCTVITTQATDEVGRIHDRMPMVVRPEHWDDWLDPGLTAVEEIRELLAPAMNGTMEAYPVSRAVNNVRNNGPDLIRPLTDGPGPQERPEPGTLF